MRLLPRKFAEQGFILHFDLETAMGVCGLIQGFVAIFAGGKILHCFGLEHWLDILQFLSVDVPVSFGLPVGHKSVAFHGLTNNADIL